jgi:hypothetical protein
MGIFYNRSADFIEITIRDYTGRLIERFKCKISDKKEYSKILRKLKEKYDCDPVVEDSWVR